MSVKVLYFGSLREKLGRANDDCVPAANARVIDIWSQLNPTLPLPEHTLCAINQDYVKTDAVIRDGDELAFFPPVTGG